MDSLTFLRKHGADIKKVYPKVTNAQIQAAFSILQRELIYTLNSNIPYDMGFIFSTETREVPRKQKSPSSPKK